MNLTWIFYECVNGPWHVANYCVIPANVTELQVPSGVGVELELVSVGEFVRFDCISIKLIIQCSIFS